MNRIPFYDTRHQKSKAEKPQSQKKLYNNQNKKGVLCNYTIIEELFNVQKICQSQISTKYFRTLECLFSTENAHY